jgi:hypothetical protein
VGKGHHESYLWEDDWRLCYGKAVGSEVQPLGFVSVEGVKKPAHDSGYKVICHEEGYLWGFFHVYSSLERVDAIVRKAKEVSVRDNMGKAGESSFYIIDAVTQHGKYVLWIDPERGYNIVKAQFLQGEGDLDWNYEPLSKGESGHKSLMNVRLEEIDGLWIPVEADCESKRTGTNASHFKTHIKRTEVKLNPEFGPDAFKADDIADWAQVDLRGSYAEDRRSYYYWHEGQVVDYQSRVVEYKVKRSGEPILVGKPLPAWETLGLDIDEGELEGKRILVFIGDMNKTPYMSWNLVEDLADRYEKLKEKGIITVVVQVPKLPAGTLKEWEKEWRSNVPFPFKVNMADEAVVKARKEWGVRYLPWLILTDTEHVVTAEGFCLPLLLGKPLPDLKEYENIDLTKAKGKRLLVCAGNLSGSTWDSMKKLDEMSGALGREGISILMLHAGKTFYGEKVDDKKLRSYYKRKNDNVPFAVPVGLTDKSFNQLCDEWGLPRSRSSPFPWLILTNREHVVVADMFSLRQIDEVIKQSADAKPEDNPLMCLVTD